MLSSDFQMRHKAAQAERVLPAYLIGGERYRALPPSVMTGAKLTGASQGGACCPAIPLIRITCASSFSCWHLESNHLLSSTVNLFLALLQLSHPPTLHHIPCLSLSLLTQSRRQRSSLLFTFSLTTMNTTARITILRSSRQRYHSLLRSPHRKRSR